MRETWICAWRALRDFMCHDTRRAHIACMTRISRVWKNACLRICSCVEIDQKHVMTKLFHWRFFIRVILRFFNYMQVCEYDYAFWIDHMRICEYDFINHMRICEYDLNWLYANMRIWFYKSYANMRIWSILNICEYSNMWILKYVNMQISAYVNNMIFEYMNINICEYMNIWILTYANMWIYEYYNMRISWYANMWISWYANIMICEYANIRICEYANIRIYEYANIQMWKCVIHLWGALKELRGPPPPKGPLWGALKELDGCPQGPSGMAGLSVRRDVRSRPVHRGSALRSCREWRWIHQERSHTPRRGGRPGGSSHPGERLRWFPAFPRRRR